MLLRQFRKIDTYSWIKLLLLGVLVAVIKCFAIEEGLVETLLFLLLFLVLGSLSNLLFKERWAFKGTHFRYLIFAIFLLLWSVNEEGYELLIWSFLLELQWQFSENFKQRKNSFWLLNSATLAALIPIVIGGNGFLFSLLSLFIVLRLGSLRPVHVVRWIFGFLFPIIIAMIATGEGWLQVNFSFNTSHSFDLMVLVPLGVVFVTTLNQFINSYRKANQTNKLRSLAAMFMVLSGSIGVFTGMGPLALALVMLGLSYQTANALHYLKGRWYIELIAILIVIYSILLIFGVTLPI
jgi:hypothetical protein